MVTPRQDELLQLIKAYMAERNGVSPSYAEMAAALGCVKSRIHSLMGRLAERGQIKRPKYGIRRIEIVEDDPAAVLRAAVERMAKSNGPIVTAATLTGLASELVAGAR